MLTMSGHASTASDQTVASLSAVRGASQVTLDGNGANLTLDIAGDITRTNAATLNFNIESRMPLTRAQLLSPQTASSVPGPP